MKDYGHLVVWLDYFNKNLKRSKGRRLSLDHCIYDPTLKELIESTKSAGFQITESKEKVRFPRRSFVRSGYVVVPKQIPKTKVLDKISTSLVAKRSKRSK